MLKNYKPSWPAVVLASVALLSLALVLTFAPAEVQTPVVEWLGWGVAAVGLFFKEILTKRDDR